MWFDHAINKEVIQFMFDNELNINQLELDYFLVGQFSDLTLRFFSKSIPKKYPEKWNKERFNALSLKIVFNEILQLNINGTKVGFSCSPIIISTQNYSEIKISHTNLDLFCRSKYLTVEEIQPYVDERWD